MQTKLQILEIQASGIEDSGEYSIKASNSAGSSQATFTVSITAQQPEEEEAEGIDVKVIEVAQTHVVDDKPAEVVTDIPAPTFKMAPKPVTVTEGATIRLACKVQGRCLITNIDLQGGRSLCRSFIGTF